MLRTRVLAIVQAGGAGGRMDVLTRERAKPALPFAGTYQLVDFPLSNLSHSGITDVWLSIQFQASSLEEEVANGRPWDLDRTHGGFRLLVPQEGTGSMDEEGFAHGNADGLFRIRDEIRASGAELVMVLSADHVYRTDFTGLIDAHVAKKAECTILTTTLPPGADAGEHATVEANRRHRVTRFEYKPERPRTDVVAAEVFVYDAAVLIEVLEELHGELTANAEAGDSGLGDYGEHLIPRLLDRGRTYAHPLDGYWRDLGQPHHYLAAHREVAVDDQGLFDDESWPILTRHPARPPARLLAGSVVEDSLVSPGARVAGTVIRSVVGPGVVVASGATVTDSVLFSDVVVAAGASVSWSIVDTNCRIEDEAVVGGAVSDPEDPDSITILGKDARVGAGRKVATGSRLEPGTTG